MENLNSDAFASFCVQSLEAMELEDTRIIMSGLEQRYD
jgi:hypothetical protein